jgi:hypothetical protein
MILILAMALIQAATSMDATASPPLHPAKRPVAGFIMIHFEVGGDRNFKVYQELCKTALKSGFTIDNRSLDYQKALWPTAKALVEEADRYNLKLTLAFTPQWAEYILQDDNKIEQVKEWLANGHELAFHHHGIDHIDWDGYSNRNPAELDRNAERFIGKLKTAAYRGTASEGFDWLKKLAAKADPGYRILTGCITDAAKDKPRQIVILTKGSNDFMKDFISRPCKQRLPDGQEIFWINHFLLRSNFNPSNRQDLYSRGQNLKMAEQDLNKIEHAYIRAGTDNIAGIVFHSFDYYRQPDVYNRFFKYLSEKHQRISTVRSLVKQFIDADAVMVMARPPMDAPRRPFRRPMEYHP